VSEFLEVHALRAGYGAGLVLHDVDLTVTTGEAVAVLGRNGVGKTTLIHCLMGIVRPAGGSILFDGPDLAGAAPHVIARRGMGLVPQGRRIFSGLSVQENLSIAARGSGRWTLESVYELLPRLAERRSHRGDQLSGGEQQMLAMGRALIGNPRLLLLDEPSEGLAPNLVDSVIEVLAELRREGLAILLVEQNLHAAVALADRVHIMEKGRMVYGATTDEFRRDPETARSLLGVS
jgi:branched-chain amino acid transport system ATP-binding protein